MEECTKSYFAGFHNLWPLLHGPTYDNSEPFYLTSTVIIIGLWFQEPPTSSTNVSKDIIKAHSMLVDQLLVKLVSNLVLLMEPIWN